MGNTVVTDHGGSIYNYAGDRGQAVFRSGGEFEITLTPGALAAGASAARSAEKLLADAGVSAEVTRTAETGAGTSVTAVCTYGRESIFNCVIVFEYDGDGSLVSMGGRLAAGVSEGDASGVTVSPATALLAFLGEVRDGRAACTEVYSAGVGYMMSVTPFGEAQLRPAWLIATDSGEFFIDAGTGSLMTGME